MSAEFRLQLSSNNSVVMQTRKNKESQWWNVFGVDAEGYGIRYMGVYEAGLKIDHSIAAFGRIDLKTN